MRVLRDGIHLVIFGFVLLFALASVTPTAAHPPTHPDHGVDPVVYYTLWSGDFDKTEAIQLDVGSKETAAAVRTLGRTTDVPFDEPPAAVERWNRGDHDEFPETDVRTSIHPRDVRLTDVTFVRDAYVAVFAVQPSTRALISRDKQPLYIGPEGELLGTVDYRIELPPGTIGPNRTVDWRLRNHGIVGTRLLLDGHPIATGAGTHTPVLKYELDTSGTTRTLTVEAEIAVAVTRKVRSCHTHHNNTSACIGWRTSIDHRKEAVTVRESIEVVPYDLSLTGAWGRYPDGDLGVVLYRDQPWLGYVMPGGGVHGVWRFYSARVDRWDRLLVSTVTGSTDRHSPLHPLQVHAYPFEPGPTAEPRDGITILETYGRVTEPQTLPTDVHLDVIEASYTSSYGIATRTDTPPTTGLEVEADGLVRGVRSRVDTDDLRAVPIHESAVALSVLNTTHDTVTVRVELTDADTSRPIQTRGRRGYVLLNGHRVETDGSGTVTTTIPRPFGGISARFQPGPWWPEPVGYVGSSTVVYVRGTRIGTLLVFYEVGVPTGLMLLGVFLIDRVTGWGLWPPWRLV